MDLALNNLQRLIAIKPKQTKMKVNQINAFKQINQGFGMK